MESSIAFPKQRRPYVCPGTGDGPCRRCLGVTISSATGWWGSQFFRHPVDSSWWGSKTKNMYRKELRVYTGFWHYLGTVLIGNELADYPMVLRHRFYSRQKPRTIVTHTSSEVRGPSLVVLWEVPGTVWGLTSWPIGVRKPKLNEC